MGYGVNKVILIGNLGSDPQIINTKNGKIVAHLSLCTDESYRNQNGEMVSANTWHRLTMWDRTAEIAQQYLHKGSQIYVEGRLKNNDYTDKDGIKHYCVEITVDKMLMLGRREQNPGQFGGAGYNQAGGYNQNSGYGQAGNYPSQNSGNWGGNQTYKHQNQAQAWSRNQNARSQNQAGTWNSNAAQGNNYTSNAYQQQAPYGNGSQSYPPAGQPQPGYGSERQAYARAGQPPQPPRNPNNPPPAQTPSAQPNFAVKDKSGQKLTNPDNAGPAGSEVGNNDIPF